MVYLAGKQRTPFRFAERTDEFGDTALKHLCHLDQPRKPNAIDAVLYLCTHLLKRNPDRAPESALGQPLLSAAYPNACA